MRDANERGSIQNTLSISKNQDTPGHIVTRAPAPSGASGEIIAAADAHARRLAEFATFLPPADAALMRSIFADGRPATQIAKLLGKPPRWIQRRVARLARRCLKPEFAFVALNIADMDPTLTRVATLCVLQGRSVRAVAEELGLSQHLVRTLRSSVMSMARGALRTGAASCSRSDEEWRRNPADRAGDRWRSSRRPGRPRH